MGPCVLLLAAFLCGVITADPVFNLSTDKILEKDNNMGKIVKIFSEYTDIDIDAEFLDRLRVLLDSQSKKPRIVKRSQPLENAERAELLRVVRQLRADKSSAELEAQQLRNRSENCESEIHRIRAQHARDVERMRLEINTLDDDIANLRKLRREDIHDETIRSKKDKDTLLNEKERLHRHIVEITNKTIEIHQENLKLHMQINKLNQLNVVYSERLEDRNKNITLLEESTVTLQEEILKLKQNFDICTEENTDMKRNKSKLTKDLSRLTQTIQEMKLENTDLQNTSWSLRQDIEDMTRTKLDLISRFDSISDLKSKAAMGIQQLNDQISNFTEESERKTIELTTAASNLADKLTAQTLNVSSEFANIKQQLFCHRKVMDLGLVYLGGKHYFFSDKSFKKTWSEAESFCRTHGLELAGIEDEDENDLIVSHLEQKFSSSWSHHWVGLTDEAIEGNWVWSSTGEPITFAAWGRHLPGGGTLENCASVFRYSSSDFRWCDHPCQTRFPFVCELMVPCS